jgi:membrane protease YdiL (CAAX protease family)
VSVSATRSWARSPWCVVGELALVGGLLLADRQGLVPLSNTPFLLALGWVSLRLRGQRWRDVGFPARREWPRAFALGTIAGLGMELFALFVTEPVIARLGGSHPDVSDLRPLVGNPLYLAIALVLNWTLAAFGEEMVWRGYLLDRLALAGGHERWGWVLALLATSVLFGCAHGESQGLAGVVQESWNGLLLGLLFVASGRRLAYPIVAHGVANTLALVLVYLDRYPGL